MRVDPIPTDKIVIHFKGYPPMWKNSKHDGGILKTPAYDNMYEGMMARKLDVLA